MRWNAGTFCGSLWSRAVPGRVPWTRELPCQSSTFPPRRPKRRVRDIASPVPAPYRMWSSIGGHSLKIQYVINYKNHAK